MLNENFSIVKEVLDRYQINKYWNLSPKYYDAYIHKICGEYLYENDIAFKNSRFIGINNYFLQTVIILLGGVLSWIKSINIPHPAKSSNKDIRIIACPFCWRYVWFKRLPQLIEDPIRVVYHPLFHYDYYKKNVEAYDHKYVQPEFYRFALKDIFKAFLIIIRSYRRLHRCSNELDDIFKIYMGRFAKIFVTPIIYGGFIERFLKHNLFDERRIIWLFDYDYHYKYIVFNNIIHRMRNKDVTVHIQHGSFIDYSRSYCNPISDYTLCCSLREKKLIETSNEFHSKPYILGAPLQTFDDVSEKELDIKWDILLLLTISDDNNFGSMRKVLSSLDTSNFRIRVRYRPASKIRDMKALGKFTKDMETSEGTTLLDDVLMAKMVICFSEDAIYTAIRSNKPIIYIRNKEILKNYDLSEESPYFFIKDDETFMNVDVNALLSIHAKCNYLKDKFILNNFGYYNLEDIKKQINSILSEIKQS